VGLNHWYVKRAEARDQRVAQMQARRDHDRANIESTSLDPLERIARDVYTIRSILQVFLVLVLVSLAVGLVTIFQSN
jgi:hypothetical protein